MKATPISRAHRRQAAKPAHTQRGDSAREDAELRRVCRQVENDLNTSAAPATREVSATHRQLGNGYVLADAETLARQSPATFELPPLEARLSLSPGEYAKLIFEPTRKHGDAERMWVRVASRRSCGSVTFYRGTLANEPDAGYLGLRFGAPVSFTSRRIVAIERGTGDALREGRPGDE